MRGRRAYVTGDDATHIFGVFT